MMEPTQLHDLPFQPFYQSLSIHATAESSFSMYTLRTSSVRGNFSESANTSTAEHLSNTFWSTMHAKMDVDERAERQREADRTSLRCQWPTMWDTREAEVTWDTQWPSQTLLWFETEPMSGIYYSRERYRPKKTNTTTRSHKKKTAAEKAAAAAASAFDSPLAASNRVAEDELPTEEELPAMEIDAPALTQRKRARLVDADPGPSRRSARNKPSNETTQFADGTPEAEDEPLSPTPSLSPLPEDASPTPEPLKRNHPKPMATPPPCNAASSSKPPPLSLFVSSLTSPSMSSSGSSTAVSPTNSEHSRGRSNSTASAGTVVESEVVQGKRKRIDDEAYEGAATEEPEGESKATAPRRTTRARAPPKSKPAPKLELEGGPATSESAPNRKRRKATPSSRKRP